MFDLVAAVKELLLRPHEVLVVAPLLRHEEEERESEERLEDLGGQPERRDAWPRCDGRGLVACEQKNESQVGQDERVENAESRDAYRTCLSPTRAAPGSVRSRSPQLRTTCSVVTSVSAGHCHTLRSACQARRYLIRRDGQQDAGDDDDHDAVLTPKPCQSSNNMGLETSQGTQLTDLPAVDFFLLTAEDVLVLLVLQRYVPKAICFQSLDLKRRCGTGRMKQTGERELSLAPQPHSRFVMPCADTVYAANRGVVK